MMSKLLHSLLIVSSLLSLASASPVTKPEIVSRSWPSGSVTCGSNTYSLSEVKKAVSAGVDDLDDPVDSYPHQYHDYEGLEMYCSGDYYNEFPILTSGIYTGGSPGADRVVFTDDGTYCAVITHTGASDDDFVACDGD